MKASATNLLSAIAQADGLNQGMLIEQLLVRVAKRKYPALHRRWEKPYGW